MKVMQGDMEVGRGQGQKLTTHIASVHYTKVVE